MCYAALLRKRENNFINYGKVIRMKNTMKDFAPTISVLTPVYNTKKYLTKCINSLLNQTFADFEIIVLDDGSTDGSSALLDRLASSDERIKVVHKMNSGYGDTMNQGIALSRGEYISVLESDDYAEPEMLKGLFEKAQRMEAELVLANYFIDHVNAEGTELANIESVENPALVNYDVYLTENERKRLAYTTPALWRCLYKKQYLVKENIAFLPTPGAAFQDTSFFIKAVMMTQKAVYISDRVLHYRRGHVCASVKDSSKVYCICNELEEVARYMEEKKQYAWRTIFPLILHIKYFWNYKRLSGTAKAHFMYRYKRDMIILDLMGWLDETVWPDWRYKQMTELLEYQKIEPLKKGCIKYMDSNQGVKLNQFIAALSLHEEIILYGAGKYGDIVLQNIYDWSLYKKVKFAVTDMPKKQTHRGIDVLPIQFFKDYKKNHVIVISAGEILTDEMSKTLDALGINDYIVLDNDLRQALKANIDLQEQIKIFTKTNGYLKDLIDCIQNQNILLKESYKKLNQIEKRMNKLEILMRDEEICRLHTAKILKLLEDTV